MNPLDRGTMAMKAVEAAVVGAGLVAGVVLSLGKTLLGGLVIYMELRTMGVLS